MTPEGWILTGATVWFVSMFIVLRRIDKIVGILKLVEDWVAIEAVRWKLRRGYNEKQVKERGRNAGT